MARALPGERCPVLPVRGPAYAPGRAWDALPQELVACAAALRGRLGRLLQALAQRLDPALTGALEHAAVAWDAFDVVAVMEPALHEEASSLFSVAATLEQEEDPARRALGLEVRMALVAALGLVDLIERRLAMLVRLRVQSGDSTLLPGSRPFLDVAAALAEAARGWA
jgi:hypothetical protein